MAEVVSIVYKPQGAAPNADGYTRTPLEQAQLVVGHGIEGDAKGGGVRQLNIMCAESVAALGAEGFHTAPGQLGEQLILNGLAIDALPVGAVIQIGEDARVEVIEPRTGCSKLEAYHSKSRDDAAHRLGVMARVVVGGPVQVGAAVRLVESAV